MRSLLNRVESAPMAIIFLDMDGVMIYQKERGELSIKINVKIGELYGERKVSSLEYLTACSYFLNKTAVENLDKLIEKVSKVAQVKIVLSSNWRNGGSLEEIRDVMLKDYPFSKLIIDKTPPEQESNPRCKCPNWNRGDQIDCWLFHNKRKLNVRTMVILDDEPHGIINRFPDHFVQILLILNEMDVQKASKIMMRQLQP